MIKPKTVMFVDDDLGLLRSLKLRCESIGLAASIFSNLPQAIKCIPLIEPDLIVLDVNMASGNGLDLCEALAEWESTYPMPVIMMTANVDSETKLRTRNAGAKYVRKGAHVWTRLEPMLRDYFGASARRSA